ncbi:hypothetical protein [Epilithonimonas arachidiradicis]|uniref:Uncharacterized protein n=1 Tax=Epilithonimonas arachidiradicis TaxID=1617282 RepID=A0A420DAG8_9FLAO|nr:hypothetical protein [Epilithonimonas arachidiradicis]RKE88285.1 hypothetical protein BXY58_1431 [Epilithonimonas arachidiradicis]GGG50013.1 hypothetical protein GCM10007332_09480 [Epilithonimonas arachidiradicis]
MKELILLLISIFLIGCNSKEEKINESKPITKLENEPADELKVIEKNGRSFYDWYFENEFPNCDIVKRKDGKCLVDTVSYFKTLRGLGTISEKFILQERERLQPCAEFIATLDYSEYENADLYEYDEYCLDIYYMYWLKSQDSPSSFTVKNVKKINENNTSLDIYEKYDSADTVGTPLSTVFLEKEKNDWKITQIKFINREEMPTQSDISGRWFGGIVSLNVLKNELIFEYHGQCQYTYPIRKINENEFEMIWARDRDCVFDNSTDENFGLKNVPTIGKPFAKYKLKNNILYAEYYYKDWVKEYAKQVQNEVFKDKYFRKN